MSAWKCIVSWLKGDYPLGFTYWITGVLPGALLAGSFYTLTYQLEHGTMSADTGLVVLIAFISVILIYTPLSLWAITASTIRYQGLLLWKVLAFLAVGRGALSYLQGVFMIIMEFVKV